MGLRTLVFQGVCGQVGHNFQVDRLSTETNKNGHFQGARIIDTYTLYSRRCYTRVFRS